MADDGNGNGFDPAETAAEEAFKGARLKLGDLAGEDGILTKSGPVTQSLLHRLVSADLEHIENELKTAAWTNIDEADMAVDAYVECVSLGMDPKPVILQIIARSSGRNRELVRLMVEALTHSTFTTNYQKGRNDSRGGKGSPLPH